MRLRLPALLGVASLALNLPPNPAAAREGPRGTPFPAVRWVPEVSIDGRWYQLRSIDGVPVQELLEFAAQLEGDQWARRFTEDFVETMTKTGNPPGGTVAVVVRDPETGVEKTVDRVPLTKANRDAILAYRYRLRARPLPSLKPQALHRAVDDLKAALDDRWSYRHAGRSDFGGALAALRRRIDAGVSTDEFGVELQKVVALGIDGHAGVTGYRLPAGGHLPFLVEPAGERFVAFHPARAAFLADGFPFVTKIDGKDVAGWCSVAAALVPKGSPQYVRQHCLRHLRDLDGLRGAAGLPKKETVDVELAAADGRRKAVTLPVAQRTPLYGVWPAGGSRLLPGKVGYLRLASMNAGVTAAEVRRWMSAFRDATGLVVDVRDNGGGSRDVLPALYSYLAAPNDPPRVFTAAAYRLHPERGRDHLAARFMYRAGAAEWSAAERRAVAEFARSFKPEWEPPRGQFSEWHYMALSRVDGPDVYHFDKPVVVLMNGKCFSATDVFLAGLKGLKGVTLLGTPSGGGSAFPEDVALGPTPFRASLGSMASFRADGSLFDGNGVRPDVVIEPTPEYHIGGPDNVLAEAVRRITGR